MLAIDYLLTALNDPRHSDRVVVAGTTIGQLGDFGLDDLDIMLAVMAIEIEFRVEVPAEWFDQKDWTIADFARAAEGLPKINEPLWAHQRLKDLAGFYQDLLGPAPSIKAILDQRI